MPKPVEFRRRAAPGDGQRATAAAVAVGLVIVLSLLKPWDALPGEPSTTAEPAPPSSTPVATPPVAEVAVPSADAETLPFGLLPPPAGPWSSLLWGALSRDHPVASATKVAHGPAGDIVVARGRDGDSPLWSSTDGSTWNPVPFGMPDSIWPGAAIVAVAAGRDRDVAVAGLRPAGSCAQAETCPALLAGLDIWTSPDGRRWTPTHNDAITAEPPGAAVSVADAGSIAVVIAAASPPSAVASRVVVSEGGDPWRTLPEATLPAGFGVTDLGVIRGRFVATGRVTQPAGGAYAAIATSGDGITWTVSALPPAPGTALGEPPTVAWHLAAGPDGALVTGSMGGIGGELWWHSRDGLTWSTLVGFAPVGSQVCPPETTACAAVADGFVVGDGTRLVAGGFVDDGPGVGLWTSSDGVEWRRLAAPHGGPSGRLSGLMLLPGGVVVSADGAPWYGAAVDASP